MKKVLIAYSSLTGVTEKMAEVFTIIKSQQDELLS
jgi:flavodoxin